METLYMAKFKCRHCGSVKKVDLREPIAQYFMTKGGRYKSHCMKTNKNTFMERIDDNVKATDRI